MNERMNENNAANNVRLSKAFTLIEFTMMNYELRLSC